MRRPPESHSARIATRNGAIAAATAIGRKSQRVGFLEGVVSLSQTVATGSPPSFKSRSNPAADVFFGARPEGVISASTPARQSAHSHSPLAVVRNPGGRLV